MADINESREKLAAELKKAEAEYRKAKADLDDAFKRLGESGVDITKAGSESAWEDFKVNYGDPVQTKANEIKAMRERLGDLLNLSVASGTPTSEGNGGETKSVTPEIRKLSEVAVKRLTESPQWKAIRDNIENAGSVGYLGLQPVEILTRDEMVSVMERKTAGDNVVTGLSATSAGALVLNDFLPTLVDRAPFWPNRLLDLIPKGTTDSDTIDYPIISTKTNNAAEVLEATSGSDGAYAESAIAFTRVQDIVEQIGHYIPVTVRALEDEGMLRTILSEFLVGGLLQRVNNQVYDGNGTTPNLSGITDRSGYQTQALGTDSRSDAVLKAVTAIRTSSQVYDNIDWGSLAVVLYPDDWQQVRLEKDGNGNYIYGPPGMGGPGFSMWGIPVVQDGTLTTGTGLVGAFNQCKFFVRRGVTVASTDSHDDWFISDIVALKASMRATFAVFKPAAFCGVTGI